MYFRGRAEQTHEILTLKKISQTTPYNIIRLGTHSDTELFIIITGYIFIYYSYCNFVLTSKPNVYVDRRTTSNWKTVKNYLQTQIIIIVALYNSLLNLQQ